MQRLAAFHCRNKPRWVPRLHGDAHALSDVVMNYIHIIDIFQSAVDTVLFSSSHLHVPNLLVGPNDARPARSSAIMNGPESDAAWCWPTTRDGG